VGASFDDLVGAQQKGLGDGEADGLGGLEVDHQLELGRELHRLAHLGATQQAVDVFGRALVLYAEAGAAWDAGRVRGRLRALGVRRRLVSAQRPGRGWAAMTDSELAVARLVAQGFSNREVAERLFVSPHTVSGHLRHVFTKLDINSRVDLTRLAGVHDAQP